MFVTVFAKSADADIFKVENVGFTVVPDTWYTDFVNWAAEKGYVSGIDWNMFQSHTRITCEQIAISLCNYIAKENIYMDDKPNTVESSLDIGKAQNGPGMRWIMCED